MLILYGLWVKVERNANCFIDGGQVREIHSGVIGIASVYRWFVEVGQRFVVQWQQGGAPVTRRLRVEPSPGPLEEYAVCFDDIFGARAQRRGFRRYLEGLLPPAERNKTLTALANTEPVAGAQRKEAQGLQWFLCEPGRFGRFGHRRNRRPQGR
jgi:hypothetical protein